MASSGTPPARAVDAERVAPHAERLEEGKPLDVVPVGVREQQGRTISGRLLHELMAETAETASGVENQEARRGRRLRQGVLPP